MKRVSDYGGRSRRHLGIGLLAFALVLVLFCIQFLQIAKFDEHAVGVTIEVTRKGLMFSEVTPDLPAARAGIRVGDLLVSVNGKAIHSLDDYDAWVEPAVRSGKPLHVTLSRRGKRLTVTLVPGIPFPWIFALATLLTTLAYLLIALVSWFQVPADPRARLLAAFALAVALELAAPTGDYGSVFWWVFGNIWFYLINGLQIGLLFHLASVIPKPAPWIKRHPWITSAYYWAGLAFAIMGPLSLFTEAFWKQLLPWTSSQILGVFNAGITVWAFAITAILAFQARRASNAVERQHAMLVLIGLLPWALFSLVLEFIGQTGFNTSMWLNIVQLLVLLPCPITIFIAIYRLHLFDIEVVIKRSLVYSTLTVIMIGLFYGALSLAGMLLSWSTAGVTSVWVISATTLLLGLLFWPMRTKIQEIIDRRLFPERMALRQRLVQVAADVPALGDISAIGNHLVHEVTSAFGVTSTTLFIADPRSGVVVALASDAPNADLLLESSLLIDSEDPGLQLLKTANRPLKASHISSMSPSLGMRLAPLDAAVVSGLVTGGQLVGLLTLGEKRDREPFGSEEIDLLSLFSRHAATILQNVRLFHSATYEGLTGLLRREAILEVLGRELERAGRYRRPISVAMADLDHFKRVNDRHGHLAGDAVLKQVATTLKRHIRSTDSIGRYGGEEFLIVLPESTLPQAWAVANKLRLAVENMRITISPAVTLHMTISIGLAVAFAEDGRTMPTALEIINDADERLLAAKRKGRNRVVPDIDHPPLARTH
ncbi:MAG: diguanylate cyclase [Acidobacteria bacterium]|nr:diguanylate cyclase [Acidobacteriota bacterium]